MFIETALNKFLQEWRNVMKAPRIHFAVFVASLIIGYGLNAWHYGDRVDNLKSILSEETLLKEQWKDRYELSQAKGIAQANLSSAKSGTSKERALKLSDSILTFLLSRSLGAPPYPKSENWDADTNKMRRYSDQTRGEFSKQFMPEIIAVRDALAREGLVDEELDRFYDHPTNQIGMRIIGERIGALALQLP